MNVADDQIYERYQAKAIDEINALGHDIAEWLGERHRGAAPVLGTGHPLADILLVKHRPMPAEVQEGVAFFGRAGQAILKSLQRLRIDPLMLYGTVCLKAAIDPDDADLEQSRAWLTRELHITQPRILVTCGEDARAFVDALAFPLAAPCTGAVGADRPLHPDDRDAGGARHRPLPRRLGLQAGVLGRVQGARHLVREPAALLNTPSEAMAQRQIVAMGGGGFLMEGRGSLLDDYVLSLAGGRIPACAISARRWATRRPTSSPSTGRSRSAAPMRAT